MTPKEAIAILPKLMSTGRPVFLWGAPGLGKSAVVKTAAKNDSRTVHDVRAVLLDPVDLRGIPTIADGRTRWAPPEFLPSENRSVLFLDELPQAAPLVQSACLSLLLDRMIGEYRLPDDACVIAAGNRAEDRAGSHRVLSPILNRAIHIDIAASVSEWLEWSLEASVSSIVRAFIQFRPTLLSQPVPADGSRAWPTPRSWHCLSDAIAACGVNNEVCSGIVGATAAAEFGSFHACYATLPSIDRIIKNPDAVSVPSGASVLYAMCGMLTEHVKGNAADIDPVMRFAARVPSEFQMMLIRDLFAVQPAAMRANKLAREWSTVNAKHVLGIK